MPKIPGFVPRHVLAVRLSGAGVGFGGWVTDRVGAVKAPKLLPPQTARFMPTGLSTFPDREGLETRVGNLPQR